MMENKMNENSENRQKSTAQDVDVQAMVIPPIPSKWHSHKYGTRHVVDRTLGGHIVYIQGSLPQKPWNTMYQDICTLSEWLEYQKKAKRV
uniref:Uncharacterized protein n=2 Tax=viral metagenome TaxID=1070528 RepID=A0A6M3XJS6_9ZZZZ